MASFSLALQTAYRNLVERHRRHAMQAFEGSPVLKTRGRQKFWYVRSRIAERVIDRYIGRDSPDVRAAMDEARKITKNRATFVRNCSALVAQLRAGGMPTLDRASRKVLNALAKVGTFRLGGTLVGTQAFRLYAAELGSRSGTGSRLRKMSTWPPSNICRLP